MCPRWILSHGTTRGTTLNRRTPPLRLSPKAHDNSIFYTRQAPHTTARKRLDYRSQDTSTYPLTSNFRAPNPTLSSLADTVVPKIHPKNEAKTGAKLINILYIPRASGEVQGVGCSVNYHSINHGGRRGDGVPNEPDAASYPPDGDTFTGDKWNNTKTLHAHIGRTQKVLHRRGRCTQKVPHRRGRYKTDGTSIAPPRRTIAQHMLPNGLQVAHSLG